MDFVLRPAASADLIDIRDYSVERWGFSQAETYLSGLFDTFDFLCAVPGAGRLRTDVLPPVRLFRYKSHHIMYRVSDNDIVILRIIHGRQNWSALLQD